MARETRSFTEYLKRLCPLVGIPYSRLTDDFFEVFTAHFNSAYNSAWKQGQWLEVCPYGEARFVGNKLTYPNDLAKTAYWTASAVSLTADAGPNPMDGRRTITKMMETAATSEHSVGQIAMGTMYPSTSYTVSFFARANGRSYVLMRSATGSDSDTGEGTFITSDGDTFITSDGTEFEYAQSSSGTGALEVVFDIMTGTVVSQTSDVTSASISPMANGFYLCQATFTSPDTITEFDNSIELVLSLGTSSAADTSYAGDTSKGAYFWGASVKQTTNCTPNDATVGWNQTGESEIDAVFQVYMSNPLGARYPAAMGYQLTPSGIQLVQGSNMWTTYYVNGVAQNQTYSNLGANPVFLYFRRTCPNFQGDDYSAVATYAVDDQIYFETSAGVGDYYKCLVATTAGQSPATTPTSWEVLPIYESLFDYSVYQAFGDWLITDGQMEKAPGAYAIAQKELDDAFEQLERQQGQVLPMKVQTHNTYQNNWQ